MVETLLGFPKELVNFTITYMLTAIAPGPNFGLVAQAGLSNRRSNVMAAVLGIALGASVSAAAIMVGVSTALQGEALHRATVNLFGGFLIYLGSKSIARALTAPSADVGRHPRQLQSYFPIAFVTALANPTTAMFFGSSALNLHSPTMTAKPLAAVAAVFLIAIGWFAAVGLVFSRGELRRLHARFSRQADLVVGVLFVLLGARALS